jgi:hypothetical protein
MSNQNYGQVPTSVKEVKSMIHAGGKPGSLLVTAGRELIDWLISKDTHNRKRVPTNVERLVKDIRENNWFITNQGIGITKGGFIVDGGHRLEAMRSADYPPVRFFLCWNVDDEAQVYVDRHHRRHMSDILTLLHDTAVSKRHIATLNVMLKIRSNWFATTAQDPMAISEEWEDKHWAIQAFDKVPKIAALPAPVFAALADKYHETKDAKILGFAAQVTLGELLESGDPAFALRNWLTRTMKLSGGSSIQKERYLKTKWALDAYLQGKRVIKLFQSHALKSEEEA